MKNQQPPLRLGVIGCGHWGPNHVRVFAEMERSEVMICADINASSLKRLANRHPAIRTTLDYRTILQDETIDAVVIATPTHTHGTITREALLAGKHVLVEKPLCTDTAEARDLTAIAERVDRVLMVGHVFLYNNGIIRLRQAIESGSLGDIHYLDAVRTNLGPVRRRPRRASVDDRRDRRSLPVAMPHECNETPRQPGSREPRRRAP